MARTAKLHRLTALTVKRYFDDPRTTAPLHDGGGLYLRKRQASAFWYLRLTEPHSHAEQWHRLFPDDPTGGYPHKGLADARSEAKRMWSARSSGVDPRAERKRRIEKDQAAEAEAKRNAARRLSVRQLFDRWAQIELQPHVRADGRRIGRKDGGAYTRRQFERRIFPLLGDTPAEGVSKADLLAVLDAVKSEGKLRTANVLLSDLRQMFRFAVSRELVIRNPLEAVSRREVGGPNVERTRVLSIEELKTLARALPASGLHPRAMACLWLILATGVRVGELIGAVTSESMVYEDELQEVAEANDVKLGFVDLVARKWYLPSTKNQRDHTIHLSDFAVTQFERVLGSRLKGCLPAIPEGSVGSPWLFPNRSNTGPVNVKTFGKQLADRQRRQETRNSHRSTRTSSLNLPGGRWTAHDLRRTAATLMADLGVSSDVIDECLNHVIESRVRRVYIRDRREGEQARAFDTLGRRLSAIAAHIPESCTVPAARADALHEALGIAG